MVYEWRKSMPFTFPVEAQVAGEFIEELEKAHGEVTAKLLLQYSRKEGAPLHKCFEWNDGIAAEKYRESQARQIINQIVVKVETPSKPAEIRAFVNVAPQSQRQGSFISTITAMQNETTRAQILRTALSELKAFQRKYAGFKEFSEVFKAIEEVSFDD